MSIPSQQTGRQSLRASMNTVFCQGSQELACPSGQGHVVGL